jgi:hypothetical protein
VADHWPGCSRPVLRRPCARWAPFRLELSQTALQHREVVRGEIATSHLMHSVDAMALGVADVVGERAHAASSASGSHAGGHEIIAGS